MEISNNQYYTTLGECSSPWLKFHLGLPAATNPRTVHNRKQAGQSKQQQQHLHRSNQPQKPSKISQIRRQEFRSFSLRLNSSGKIRPTVVNFPRSDHCAGNKTTLRKFRNGDGEDTVLITVDPYKIPAHSVHPARTGMVKRSNLDQNQLRSLPHDTRKDKTRSWSAGTDNSSLQRNRKRAMELVTTTPIRLLGMLRSIENSRESNWRNGKENPINFPPVTGVNNIGGASSSSAYRTQLNEPIKRRDGVVSSLSNRGPTARVTDGRSSELVQAIPRSFSSGSLPGSWKYSDSLQPSTDNLPLDETVCSDFLPPIDEAENTVNEVPEAMERTCWNTSSDQSGYEQFEEESDCNVECSIGDSFSDFDCDADYDDSLPERSSPKVLLVSPQQLTEDVELGSETVANGSLNYLKDEIDKEYLEINDRSASIESDVGLDSASVSGSFTSLEEVPHSDTLQMPVIDNLMSKSKPVNTIRLSSELRNIYVVEGQTTVEIKEDSSETPGNKLFEKTDDESFAVNDRATNNEDQPLEKETEDLTMLDKDNSSEIEQTGEFRGKVEFLECDTLEPSSNEVKIHGVYEKSESLEESSASRDRFESDKAETGDRAIDEHDTDMAQQLRYKNEKSNEDDEIDYLSLESCDKNEDIVEADEIIHPSEVDSETSNSSSDLESYEGIHAEITNSCDQVDFMRERSSSKDPQSYMPFKETIDLVPLDSHEEELETRPLVEDKPFEESQGRNEDSNTDLAEFSSSSEPSVPQNLSPEIDLTGFSTTFDNIEIGQNTERLDEMPLTNANWNKNCQDAASDGEADTESADQRKTKSPPLGGLAPDEKKRVRFSSDIITVYRYDVFSPTEDRQQTVSESEKDRTDDLPFFDPFSFI